MRKMLLTGVMAIGLSGCATLSQNTVNFINQVEQITAQACKFIPEAVVILNIFNSGVGTTVNAVANAICAAVPPPASAKFRSLPRFATGMPPVVVGNSNGVQIIGWRAP